MPNCGCQVINCDVPIRLDSYRGCSFRCGYCIEHLKGRSPAIPVVQDRADSLERFIRGDRRTTTNWCDWKIPLHWGGLSDPFQPCEQIHGISLSMLRIFARTGYPVIISTKSLMLLREPYLSLLSECNVVLQVSLVSNSERYRRWERHAPSFRSRLKMLWKLSGRVKRLIVRVQPYMPELLGEILRLVPIYAASGVYGITVEGLKWNEVWGGLTVYEGGSMRYSHDALFRDFIMLRECCHSFGLRFYSADNKLRHLGDSPTCCGCDDLAGFTPHVANLNYGSHPRFTSQMERPGTAGVFRSFQMTGDFHKKLAKMSYKEAYSGVLSGSIYSD